MNAKTFKLGLFCLLLAALSSQTLASDWVRLPSGQYSFDLYFANLSQTINNNTYVTGAGAANVLSVIGSNAGANWTAPTNLSAFNISCGNENCNTSVRGNLLEINTTDTSSSYDDSGVVTNMTAFLYNLTLGWTNWTNQAGFNNNISSVNASLWVQCYEYADSVSGGVYDDAWLNASLTTISLNQTDFLRNFTLVWANWSNFFAWQNNASQWNVTILTQAAAYADANDADTVYSDLGVVQNMTAFLQNFTLTWANFSGLKNISGNSSFANNASGVPCSGISGAVSNLCTLTASGEESDPLWSANWTNVSQVNASCYSSAVAYADANDANTNAETLCAGDTTYLSGEGNCNDISLVYWDECGDAYACGWLTLTDLQDQIPLCGANQVLTSDDGDTLSCVDDQTGGNAYNDAWLNTSLASISFNQTDFLRNFSLIRSNISAINASSTTDELYDDSGVVTNMTDSLLNWSLVWSNWTAQFSFNNNISSVNDTLWMQCSEYADSVAGGIYDDTKLNATLATITLNQTSYAKALGAITTNQTDFLKRFTSITTNQTSYAKALSAITTNQTNNAKSFSAITTNQSWYKGNITAVGINATRSLNNDTTIAAALKYANTTTNANLSYIWNNLSIFTFNGTGVCIGNCQ